MPDKFSYKGLEYTQEEIAEAAENTGVSLEEYLNANPEIKAAEQTETEVPFRPADDNTDERFKPVEEITGETQFKPVEPYSTKKETGSAETAAVVEPETKEQQDTGSASENISLDLPKPKTQKETPQFTLEDLKEEDEETLEVNVKEWIKANGLDNDFTVMTPVNPLQEKIRITSNQTGESFDYVKSQVIFNPLQTSAGDFSTPIDNLNNWMYQNGRHVKGEAQTFYKKTNTSLTEAPNLISDEVSFEGDAFVSNFEKASLKATKQVKTLLNTDQFKKYSLYSLLTDSEKAEEYAASMYELLEDSQQFNEEGYLYFNEEGKEKIIKKAFDNVVYNKSQEEKIQSNILVAEFLRKNNINQSEKDVVTSGITKKNYELSILNDSHSQDLLKFAKAEKALQERLRLTEDPTEKIQIKGGIEKLNARRKKFDANFVPLADVFTGKVTYVNPKNLDQTNTNVEDISQLVEGYNTRYSSQNHSASGLQKIAAEIGVESYANTVLGEKVIPYVYTRGQAFTNIKIKDLYQKYYDSTGGEFAEKITGFSSAKFTDKNGKELRGEIDQYYDKKLDLAAKTTAIGELLYLNKSVEFETPGFLQAAADGFMESLPIIGGKDNITLREKTDQKIGLLDQANVKLTEGMKKAAVPTFKEELGAGIGGSVVPIAEFVAVNYATAGLGNLVRATSGGAKVLNWYNTLGKSKNILERGIHTIGQMGLEETKTQIMGLDTGSGAAFSLFHKLAPLNTKIYLNPILEKATGSKAAANIITPLVDTVFGSTLRAGAAMEVAGATEHLVKDGELNKYIDENYQNLDQVSKRMFVQGFSMSFLGMGKILNPKTYYSDAQFAGKIKLAEDYIKKLEVSPEANKEQIQRQKEVVQILQAERYNQGVLRDMSDPNKMGEMMKKELSRFDSSIAEANNDATIDFEVGVTVEPEAKSNGTTGFRVEDGKLKVKIKIVKNRVTNELTLKDGSKVTAMKNYSTIGHEGYHARNIIEAWKSLKAERESAGDKSKITEAEVSEKANEIVNKDYNKLKKIKGEFKEKTGIDLEGTEAQVIKEYPELKGENGKIREEILAAVRDKIYNDVSKGGQSIFTTRRIIKTVKEKFGIKGNTETVNDFLEIMDRLSNKNKKSKFTEDIDVSEGAATAYQFASEVVRKMDQKDLSEFEKIEQKLLDLELKLDTGELDYFEYEQSKSNLELKLDRASRDRAKTNAATKPTKEKDFDGIGQRMNKLVPEGVTKEQYKAEHAWKANLEVLALEGDPDYGSVAKGVDGYIRNLLTRAGYEGETAEIIESVKRDSDLRKDIDRYDPTVSGKFGQYLLNRIQLRLKDVGRKEFKRAESDSYKKVDDLKGEAYSENALEGFEDIDLSVTSTEVKPEAESIYDRPTFKERGLVNETNEPIIEEIAIDLLSQLGDVDVFGDKSKNKRKLDFWTEADKKVKANKAGLSKFKKSYGIKDILEGSLKDAVLENLPTFFLGGKTSGTEVKGGMPFAIQKRVNGEFLNYPDWVGKKIDRESTAEGSAGRTSGNEIVRRAPSSSVKSIKEAFAKRGSDISVNFQIAKTSVMQKIMEALGKEDLTPNEAKIVTGVEKLIENSPNTTFDIAEAKIRESSIRMLEQRDLDLGEFEKIMKDAPGLSRLMIGKTAEERESILKDGYVKDPKHAEQFVKAISTDINKIYSVYEKAEYKKLDKKIRKKEKLNEQEAEAYKNIQKDIELSIKNKALGKVELPRTVNKNGTLTDRGAKLVQEGNDFISDIKTVKNNKDKLNVFFAQYADAIRYNGTKYLNNKKIAELFPGLSKIKGLSLEALATGEGNRWIYKGKPSLDPRRSEGKALSYDPKVRAEYNNNTGVFLEAFMKSIDEADTLKKKSDVISSNFASNLISLGASISKLRYTELDAEGKPIDPKNAVWEHNPPRLVIQSQFLKYAAGDIDAKQLKTLSEGWEVNLISKEADKILESSGFRQKGTPTERIQALTNAGYSFANIESVNPDGSLKKNATKFTSMKQKDLDLNLTINEIIERSSKIGVKTNISDVVARREGKDKGKYQYFLGPAAEDLQGLYYTMLGKRKQGEVDKKFFEDNLVKPYVKGISDMEKAKTALMSDYKSLNKTFKSVMKENGVEKLNKDIPGAKITGEQAIRIYLWNKSGFEVPGLTEVDQRAALDYIYSNPSVLSYAESLQAISKRSEWSKPSEYWDAQSILTDLTDIGLNVNRKAYLETFSENQKVIFSKENLNKMEAAYGSKFRGAVEDVMFRMESGTNRVPTKGTIADKWNGWLNKSVGSIMFMNRRSAAMQLLSTINFVNTGDNNPLKAAQAFSNQPQYWKDWATIFNSSKLKERRGGLKSDVNEAELAAAAAGSKNNPEAVISYLLQKGFVLTKFADSFAIATGGATFYRNRANTYKKQTVEVDGKKTRKYTDKQAEEKAWDDFSLVSDQTQQSGDPMLVSKQQADPIGRVVLAFQNTAMQMARIQKRNFQDLNSRRRIEGKSQFQSDVTYLSRIGYYTFIQNAVFSALSNGLFTLMPGFDEEEETSAEKDKKMYRALNGMVDTTLRGTGIAGGVIATTKNTLLKYMEEQDKTNYNKDNSKVLLEALNIAPPLGSKARKFLGGLNMMDWEKDVIDKRGWDVTIDNKFQLSPSYQVLGNFSSSVANIPIDRVVTEVNALSELFDDRNSKMQKLAIGMGWKGWEVGTEVEEHLLIRKEAKATRKEEGIQKTKAKAKEKKDIERKALKEMTNEEYKKYNSWKRKNKGKRLYDYLQLKK